MKTGFIMLSKLLSITSAAALAIILSTPTQANQIDVTGSLAGGSLTFTAVGGNALQVSSDGFSGQENIETPLSLILRPIPPILRASPSSAR